MASESLWNYCIDETIDYSNENKVDNYRIDNSKEATTISFEYNTKIIGSRPDDNNTFDTEGAVQLKYLSNFWRSLDLLLINCEIYLHLAWSKDCIISETLKTARVSVPPSPADVSNWSNISNK